MSRRIRRNTRYATKHTKPLSESEQVPQPHKRESCKSKPVRYGTVVGGKFQRNTDMAEENRPKRVRWERKNYYVNPNVIGASK